MKLNSPAGTMDALKAAIYNGADAVYLGIKLFNARRLASNFSIEELKEAIRLAHMNDVKIYLTMNTLVRNNEMQMWFKTLEEAYLAGIDAVILQEITLAPYIKRFFPGLRVHASTQASFMSFHGINIFEKDLDLVVLARELTEDQVKEIRKHTGVELEVFVHGHMCISYSGQCLISSLIGKRSGNRGICASSCRKEYNRQGYLISAKDLNLADDIGRLKGAGVDAIKIEGRMKSPEYVAVSTRTYRRQIDATSPGKLSKKDLDNLKITFNREFTSGFFTGNKSIVGKEMPMNRGVYLGTVDRGSLRLEHDLSVNDGVGFWHPRGSGKLEGFILREMTVNGKEGKTARRGDYVKIPSDKFVNGSRVFLTSSNEGQDILGKPVKKAFPVDVEGHLGGRLIFRSGDDTIESDVVLQEAKNQALDMRKVEAELSRSEIIAWKIGEARVDSGMFLPVSSLTRMRKALEDKIMDRFVPKRQSQLEPLPPVRKAQFSEPRLIVKVYSLDELSQVNGTDADTVYFDIFSPDAKAAKALCQKRFFLDTPVVATDEDIERMQRIIDDVKPDGITIGNWGALAMRFDGERHGKHSLNVFNDIAVESLREKGVIPTVSVELSAKQVLGFSNKEFIYYAHGRIPVMHFKGEYTERSLTDEKGFRFPLRVVNGNTEMLYSRPIALLDKVRELKDGGVMCFLIDVEKDAKRIVETYSGILKGIPQDVSMLKEGTTVGNFNKGVA